MRAVIQRVTGASLSIDSVERCAIEKGFVILFGVHEDDSEQETELLIKKIVGLRVFEDENGKMNRSLNDVGGEVMLVSQFTLYGDCTHGNRPSFIQAARPEKAIPLYELAIRLLQEQLGVEQVKTGVFGADMAVSLVNDGPVTILMDTSEMARRK